MRTSSVGLGIAVVAIAVACGGSTNEDVGNGTTTGGATAGGASAGSGGTGAGGEDSGGTGTAGDAAGGSPTGGQTSGGAGTGGADTGGAGTGGTGTGGIDCSMVGCAPPPRCSEGCTEPCGCCFCGDGEQTEVGSVIHVCTGGCWAEPDCLYDGQGYFVGDSFSSSDGCNTCGCTEEGMVACTALACPCYPDREYWRDYVGTPETCPLIDFVCPTGATHFSNECGCGCEQSADCPQWLDCMPGGAPPECSDFEAYAALCPYTEIAF